MDEACNVFNYCHSQYSNVPNKRLWTFISIKVCTLGSIKVERQTLTEINVHTRLFGTLEYVVTHYLLSRALLTTQLLFRNDSMKNHEITSASK